MRSPKSGIKPGKEDSPPSPPPRTREKKPSSGVGWVLSDSFDIGLLPPFPTQGTSLPLASTIEQGYQLAKLEPELKKMVPIPVAPPHSS